METENLRVLLAEDDEVNSLTIRKLLEYRGHVVDAVANGAEALNLLGVRDYDVILMDIRMPVMDGLEATRRIRFDAGYEKYAKVPIIALTAHAMLGDREKFLAAGMSGYLSKPVELEELIEVMRKVVRGSAQGAN